MRIARLVVAAAATASLTLALASCSSGGSGDGGALTWEDSPLTEYWNVGYDPNETDEEMQARFEAENAEREDLIAQCMADEGFEYIPTSNTGGAMISSGDEVEWNPEAKEWVEKWGYGIVNNPWNEYWEENESPPSGPDEYVDPNADYVNTLSESEQAAYYETLYGKMDAPSSDNGEEEDYVYDWKKAGCQGAADHAVYGDTQDTWAQFEDLLTRMSSIYEQVEDDPAIVELDSKWSACMADAGFTFNKQPDANMSINDELSKIYEGFTEEDHADGDPARKNPEMIELGKKEIELALADLECRSGVNYNDERLTVQFKLEEQFITENQQELNEYKAAMEQATKK